MSILHSKTEKEDGERARLADEMAGIKAEIKALRTERESTTQVVKLRQDVETLKLEKSRLTEDNDRKIRETEHKVGLLKTKQDHEVANARRETELEVREKNLAADEKRFRDEMKFQREHMQREVDRFDGIAKALMERLPTIEVNLDGGVTTSAKARSSRKED